MNQMALFDAPAGTAVRRNAPALNDDGISVKGCSIIYAPKGQAGEYAPLAANPYRGCGHKCSYCLDGDTLIQMSDGSTKPIRDIEVGNEIIGVLDSGNGRRAWNNRVVVTNVIAKVVSQKDAYQITLDDGTTVICSGDHRWLTDRGWKYTTGAMSGKDQRPYLTTNNKIRQLSSGATETPSTSRDYMMGYLAGMISGDANLAIYDYSDRKRPSGKTAGVQYRFRLALKDDDAIYRTKEYLAEFGIPVTEFDFNHNHDPLLAIGTTSPERYHKIDAIASRRDGSSEWSRGWLAGIFDSEGSHGKEALRIYNTDDAILATTERALSTHGFPFSRTNHTDGREQAITVMGGRDQTVRFWQLANPCITRKFDIDGVALRGSSRIVSIEPMEEVREMYDIMTGTENFIANGMVSHNCYVPLVLKMKRPDFDAGAEPRPDFLNKLVKDARKYEAAGITEQVMLSFTTDPYHPGDNSLTAETIAVLQEHGLGVCTLTKGGSRALRDIHLFRPDRDAFATTLTSLDDAFSLKWERGAALPGDRIATLRRFHDAGIFTWVSLEPTLDVESSLAIVQATHEFVDLYKIGRVNYLPMTKTTDWQDYTLRMIDLCQRLGVTHYVKKDLQPFLPSGYHNPLRVVQHH